MSAREEVLRRIRAANRAAGSPSTVDIPRAYRTAGGHGAVELLDLLRDRLVDYRARVVDTDAAGVPAAIADALAGLDGQVVVPAGLPEGWCPAGVPDHDGPAALLDAAAAVVTACAAACAETGTIALDGGADQGRRAISLVPDVHVCVVRADQVVATVPELIARLDPTRPCLTNLVDGVRDPGRCCQGGAKKLVLDVLGLRANAGSDEPDANTATENCQTRPRPLTFISGPSATSDIELERVEGVHGPRTLVVILVR